MKRCLFMILVLFAAFVIPHLAHAAPSTLREYYTWGGTVDVVSKAFQKLALVMSDERYRGLFSAFGVLGILAASLYVILASWARGMPSLWPWMNVLAVLLIGGSVYLGFVRKTDTIYIYDTTTGESVSVPGVPDAVVVSAGFFNKIEKGLIDLVDTSSLDGMSYRDGTGGVGLQLLVDAAGTTLNEQILPLHFYASLMAYIKDCYMYAVALSMANPNELYQPPNNDLVPVLARGAHPAVFTTWYDGSSPGGVTVTCQVAWSGGTSEAGTAVQGLSSVFSSYTDSGSYTTEYAKAVCASAGFDVTNPTTFSRCRTLFQTTLSRVLSLGLSPSMPGASFSGFLKSLIAAKAVYDVLNSQAPSVQVQAMTQREVRTGGIGVGLAANRYIPMMKAAISAVFLGIVPFLLVFVLTPLYKRVLQVLVGGFAFLAAWGVCDAVIHSFLMERAVRMFQEAQGLGIAAVTVSIPKKALDAMSLFGFMRMASIFFAGMIARMVFGFGGIMLAQFAGALTGRIEGAGQAAARTAFQPEVRSSVLESVATSAAREQAVHWAVRSDGFTPFSMGQALYRTAELGGQTRMGFELTRAYGGLAGAVQAVADSRTAKVISGEASYRGLEAVSSALGRAPVEVARQTAQVAKIQETADAEAKRDAYLHFSPTDPSLRGLFNWSYTIGLKEAAARGGAAEAEKRIVEEEFGGNWAEYHRFLSTVSAERTFGSAQGAVQFYQQLKQSGFKGSLRDMFSTVAQVEQGQVYASADWVKQTAERYFGGDMPSAVKALASFHYGRLGGLIQKAQEHGLSPEEYVQLGAHLEAVERLGEMKAYLAVGDRGIMERTEASLLSSTARLVNLKTVQEIFEKGAVSPETQQLAQRLSASPLGRQALKWEGSHVAFASPRGQVLASVTWREDGQPNVVFTHVRSGRVAEDLDVQRQLKERTHLTQVISGTVVDYQNVRRSTVTLTSPFTFTTRSGERLTLTSGVIQREGDFVTIRGITQSGIEVQITGMALQPGAYPRLIDTAKVSYQSPYQSVGDSLVSAYASRTVDPRAKAVWNEHMQIMKMDAVAADQIIRQLSEDTARRVSVVSTKQALASIRANLGLQLKGMAGIGSGGQKMQGVQAHVNVIYHALKEAYSKQGVQGLERALGIFLSYGQEVADRTAALTGGKYTPDGANLYTDVMPTAVKGQAAEVGRAAVTLAKTVVSVFQKEVKGYFERVNEAAKGL
ncbi:MAG: conjugal transfer protein TraG N-terminal domain-containing protein, partial [Thermofilaceae archaeon]